MKETKHYIITGAGGFVGINTVLELMNTEVTFHLFDTTLTNLENILKNKETNSKFHFYTEDLSEKTTASWLTLLNSISGDIKFIHLASTVGVDKVIKFPETMISDTLLNINLIKALNLTTAKIDFVFASTSEIYGESKMKSESGKMILHTPENNPRGVYASQKLTAENLYINCSTNPNINVKVLRLFSLIGRYQNPNFVIPKFIQLANNNQNISVNGNGSQSRNFTDVRVLADLFQKEDFWRNNNIIFNIGSIRNCLTIHQVAHIINKKIGNKSMIIYTDGPVGEQLRIPQIERISKMDLKYIDNSFNNILDWILEEEEVIIEKREK